MRILKSENNNEFVEDWIEVKFRKRLSEYKNKYPNFDAERIIREVKTWNTSMQKYSPYMEDEDIKSVNKRIRKQRRLDRLSELKNF